MDDEEQLDRDELAKAIRARPKHAREVPIIDALRKIVTEKQAARVRGKLVDLFTASAIVAVYDRLNDKNKEDFASRPLGTMAVMAFKLIR